MPRRYLITKSQVIHQLVRGNMVRSSDRDLQIKHRFYRGLRDNLESCFVCPVLSGANKAGCGGEILVL